MSSYFVRGLSRSGGTLMATLLDAHPEVSMSYETYEHLLITPVAICNDAVNIKKLKKDALGYIKKELFSDSKQSQSNFVKFIGRAERAGITPNELHNLLIRHFESGLSFNDFKDRMLFVETLTKEKRRKENKKHWGAKIVSVYDELYKLYPESYFLFMLRDGRDIAASRKVVGDFNQTIEHVAEGWCKQIRKFEKFSEKIGKRAVFVPYERLATQPESELRDLMLKLDLPWSDQLLSYHTLNLSIHRNSTGHLSGKQVKSPINTSSIGRWHKDLEKNEIDRFESIAGEMLEKLEYL